MTAQNKIYFHDFVRQLICSVQFLSSDISVVEISSVSRRSESYNSQILDVPDMKGTVVYTNVYKLPTSRYDSDPVKNSK